jgi:hypothetical protein
MDAEDESQIDDGASRSKRNSSAAEPCSNRDILLMSTLLVLASSYAWNVLQSCTTELQFAIPNLYGKRGLMAPWYLASILRGALGIVQQGMNNQLRKIGNNNLSICYQANCTIILIK